MIIKSKHAGNYTVLSNEIFNSGLCLEAIGLLSYFLSLPSDWVIYKTQLHAQLNIGREKLDRVFKELQEKGYVVSVKKHEANGQISYDHIVYDKPYNGEPQSEIPHTAFPSTAEQPLLNTNIQSTEEQKKQEQKKQDYVPADLNLKSAVKKNRIMQLTIPTIEQVEKFFADNGYSRMAGVKAWNYYNDGNWTDSSGRKVINWKQKMRINWFKDENKQQSNNNKMVY